MVEILKAKLSEDASFYAFTFTWLHHVVRLAHGKVVWDCIPGYWCVVRAFLNRILHHSDILRTSQRARDCVVLVIQHAAVSGCAGFLARAVLRTTNLYDKEEVNFTIDMMDVWLQFANGSRVVEGNDGYDGRSKEYRPGEPPSSQSASMSTPLPQTFFSEDLYSAIQSMTNYPHFQVLLKLMTFVYMHAGRFYGDARRRLLDIFLEPDTFFSLFLHWHAEVRRVFIYFLVFRLQRDGQSPLDPKCHYSEGTKVDSPSHNVGACSLSPPSTWSSSPRNGRMSSTLSASMNTSVSPTPLRNVPHHLPNLDDEDDICSDQGVEEGEESDGEVSLDEEEGSATAEDIGRNIKEELQVAGEGDGDEAQINGSERPDRLLEVSVEEIPSDDLLVEARTTDADTNSSKSRSSIGRQTQETQTDKAQDHPAPPLAKSIVTLESDKTLLVSPQNENCNGSPRSHFLQRLRESLENLFLGPTKMSDEDIADTTPAGTSKKSLVRRENLTEDDPAFESCALVVSYLTAEEWRVDLSYSQRLCKLLSQLQSQLKDANLAYFPSHLSTYAPAALEELVRTNSPTKSA